MVFSLQRLGDLIERFEIVKGLSGMDFVKMSTLMSGRGTGDMISDSSAFERWVYATVEPSARICG